MHITHTHSICLRIIISLTHSVCFVKQNGLTPLHMAAQDDMAGVAEVLLNHGAEIDAQTKVRVQVLWCFHRLNIHCRLYCVVCLYQCLIFSCLSYSPNRVVTLLCMWLATMAA